MDVYCSIPRYLLCSKKTERMNRVKDGLAEQPIQVRKQSGAS